MPALSVKQRRLMALAEHHPNEVYAQDKGVLKMSQGQLHDYAATKETSLPAAINKMKLKGTLRSRKKSL